MLYMYHRMCVKVDLLLLPIPLAKKSMNSIGVTPYTHSTHVRNVKS